MKKCLCGLLIAVLCAGLCGCVSVSASYYSNAEKYSVGGFSYDPKTIDAVEINWLSGQVRVAEAAGDRLTVSEAAEGLTEDQEMRWLLDGRTLRIQFWKSGLTMSGNVKKRLYMEIPAGIDVVVNVTSGDVELGALSPKALSVSCTSGDVRADTVTADSVTLKATSGDFRFGPMEAAKALTVNCTSGDVSIENLRTASAELNATSGNIRVGPLDAKISVKVNTTSGDVYLQAVKSESVKISTASGDGQVGLYQCGKADVTSTSGDVTLTLLHGTGAAVRFNTASGAFNGKSAKRGETLVIGDGACTVAVSTASGNLTVNED